MMRSKTQHTRHKTTDLFVELLEVRQVLSTLGLPSIAAVAPHITLTVNMRLVAVVNAPQIHADLAGSVDAGAHLQASIPQLLPVVQDLADLSAGTLNQITGQTPLPVESGGLVSPPVISLPSALSHDIGLPGLSAAILTQIKVQAPPPAESGGPVPHHVISPPGTLSIGVGVNVDSELAGIVLQTQTETSDEIPPGNILTGKLSADIRGPNSTDDTGSTVQLHGTVNSNKTDNQVTIVIPPQTGSKDSHSATNPASTPNQDSATAHSSNQGVLVSNNLNLVNTIFLNQFLTPAPNLQTSLLPEVRNGDAQSLDLFAVIGDRDEFLLDTNGFPEFSDAQHDVMAPEIFMDQLSPETSGLMFEAAPFNLDSMETALQQFLHQLGDLRESMNNLVQRVGPSPWIFMSMALAITLHEMIRRRMQRLQEQNLRIGIKGIERLHGFSGPRGMTGSP